MPSESGCSAGRSSGGVSNQRRRRVLHLFPLLPAEKQLDRRALHAARGSMMPTWKQLSRNSQRGEGRACQPWSLLLHLPLLLPHKVLRAVDPRASGACQSTSACVLTAAADQLPKVTRPAAERAPSQIVSRTGPHARQRGGKLMSRRRLCWSRRRGMPQLHRLHCLQRRRRQARLPQLPRRLCWSRRRGLPQLHRQQRQNGTRMRFLPSLRSSANIVAKFVGANAASGAICTRCA